MKVSKGDGNNVSIDKMNGEDCYNKEKMERVKEYMEKYNHLIQAVVNRDTRIPVVKYEKDNTLLNVFAKYRFHNEIMIRVKMENKKFKIKFLDDNQGTEKELCGDNNEAIPFLEHTIVPYYSFVQNEKKNILIILSGTSGSGKSTLSTLLSYFLNIKRILSTDIIREILRIFQVQHRLLQYSTFESWKIETDGETNGESDSETNEETESETNGEIKSKTWRENDKEANNLEAETKEARTQNEEKIKAQEKQETDPSNSRCKKKDTEEERTERCIKYYLRQCDLMFPILNDIIEDFVKRNESLIIEGVHLNPEVINKLMEKNFKHCFSFLIYVKDKETSIKRFSKRCNTSGNATNRYIENINYINNIQRYLLETAEHIAPNIHSIENVDIYRSLAKLMEVIHVSIS